MPGEPERGMTRTENDTPPESGSIIIGRLNPPSRAAEKQPILNDPNPPSPRLRRAGDLSPSPATASTDAAGAGAAVAAGARARRAAALPAAAIGGPRVARRARTAVGIELTNLSAPAAAEIAGSRRRPVASRRAGLTGSRPGPRRRPIAGSGLAGARRGSIACGPL